MNVRQQGITLLEVLVVMILVGVMFSMAMPAFNNLTASMALTTTADSLLGTLNYARAQALQLNNTVSVMPVTANNWSNGWCVAPTQTDGTLPASCTEAGKTYLRQVEPPKDTDNWTFTGNGPSYQFNSRGQWANVVNVPSQMAVKICRNDLTSGRQISIIASGRVISAIVACP